MRAMARGSRGRFWAGWLIAGALVLTACGESKYHYANASAEKTFFKIPSNWNRETLTEKDRENRPLGSGQSVVSLWHVGFSDPAAQDGEDLSVLTGDAFVYGLTFSPREQFSLSRLRATQFLGVDPLFNDDSAIAEKLEIVGVEKRETGGGGAGTRVVANVNVAEDGQPARWITIDATTAIDFNLQRAYVLTMRCEAACYKQHQKTADSIAASWKVNT